MLSRTHGSEVARQVVVRHDLVPEPAFPLLHLDKWLTAQGMQSVVTKKIATQKRAGIRLLLSVHFDAMRHAPGKYLVAMWWKLRGKRVRSRGQLAPLLAMSKQAYGLWLLSEPELDDCRAQTPPPIIVFIDGTGEGLWDTLHSVAAEGLQSLVIGTSEVPTIAKAARATDWAKTPWLMVLAAGDTLAPGAANTYRTLAEKTDTDVIYADDDLIDSAGRRVKPHFKPDWNSELFRHFDFISKSCILRVRPDDFSQTRELDWAAQLTATAIDRGTPVHIGLLLHHRKTRSQPRLPSRVQIGDTDLERVTVIVPTRNRVDLLRACCEGLVRTDYPDFEVIVVDNGSDEPEALEYIAGLKAPQFRVLRQPGPFNFSALNNRAVREADAPLLCLLNNDIEVIDPTWLRQLSVQAMRPEVGAVGARLLYPDGRIQHAGVVIGVGGGAAHAHRLLQPDAEGYFQRHCLPQFVSAVTAACLVVQRKRFIEVGGLDETNFEVAFNDVDLCMRLNQRGWQSFYEPRATLVHHESVSRGFDRDPAGAARLAGEIAALKRLWGTDEVVDPFHHRQLNRFSEQFVVQL